MRPFRGARLEQLGELPEAVLAQRDVLVEVHQHPEHLLEVRVEVLQGVVDLPRADDDHLQLQRDHLGSGKPQPGGRVRPAATPSSTGATAGHASARPQNGSPSIFSAPGSGSRRWPVQRAPDATAGSWCRAPPGRSCTRCGRTGCRRSGATRTPPARRWSRGGRWPGSARTARSALLALGVVRLSSTSWSTTVFSRFSCIAAGRRRRPGCCCTFHQRQQGCRARVMVFLVELAQLVA